MFNLLKYITIVLIILSGKFAFAEENSIAKTDSKIVFELIEEEPVAEMSFEDKLKILIEAGQKLNNAIEGDKIDSDFTKDLAKYFPEDDETELFEKQGKVRTYMKLYRYFSGLYSDIKAKMLIPQEAPLIVDDNEYDMGYNRGYITAPEGSVAVVEDFKKVLSYGNNPKDREAISAKKQRDLENKEDKTRMEELWITLSKVDWKNTLFGSTPVDSPFTGNLGAGEWFQTESAKVRILSEISKVDNRNIINMVFNFKLSDNYFIQASALNDNPYINIDFVTSQNLTSAEVIYPAPVKIDIGDKDRMLAYGGTFSIPFTAYIDDSSQDLDINAIINARICDFELKCSSLELKPRLLLERGEGLSSQYENYVTLIKNNVPKVKNENLEIISVIASEPNDGEKVLRIVFDNSYTLSNFEVLVESLEGIELSRPRVSIDGRKIVVRISPKEQNVDILGKEFLITGIINKLYSVRGVFKATDKSLFDIMSEKLSLALLFLAILGGFLLNFMPCVFPVLSIKLMSLNKIGGRNISEVKKSFYLTILGILITFFILSLVLCLVKYLGYSIGWGMQFQNPFFLICMIFIVVVFIGYVFEFQKITTPKWLNNLMFKSQGENNLLYFMTGVLAVIMATPCTAPYLGTTIGFALAGSYVDIIAILMSVALGLSLPYIFFVIFPSLAIYVPKPGDWMGKMNKIMVVMLMLTLIWLISIYYAQTNIWATVRMFFYSVTLLFVLWFRYLLILEIDIEVETDEQRKRLKKKFNNIALFMVVVLFGGAMFDGGYNFMKKREEISQVRENEINIDLINQYVSEGKIVVVNVQADWCLTCMYNDINVFSNIYVKRLVEKNNIEIINVDWTNYNKSILEFMEKYGRKGLPFYIVYSKKVPDGMVLPEVLNDMEFTKIINSVSD